MIMGLDKPYEVTHTKRGLDSVEYHVMGIDRLVWDEDEEWWEHDDSYEDMDALDTITDELRKAIDEARSSYYSFLDYESGGYHGIEIGEE